MKLFTPRLNQLVSKRLVTVTIWFIDWINRVETGLSITNDLQDGCCYCCFILHQHSTADWLTEINVELLNRETKELCTLQWITDTVRLILLLVLFFHQRINNFLYFLHFPERARIYNFTVLSENLVIFCNITAVPIFILALCSSVQVKHSQFTCVLVINQPWWENLSTSRYKVRHKRMKVHGTVLFWHFIIYTLYTSLIFLQLPGVTASQ